MAQPLVGVVGDPENSVCWPVVKQYLTPAAERGGVPLLGEHHLVWIVAIDGELKGAATTRLCPDDGFAEVILVGGRDHKEWLKPLDNAIGEWAGREGMASLRACGRKGWKKTLGWPVIGEENGFVMYERRL